MTGNYQTTTCNSCLKVDTCATNDQGHGPCNNHIFDDIPPIPLSPEGREEEEEVQQSNIFRVQFRTIDSHGEWSPSRITRTVIADDSVSAARSALRLAGLSIESLGLDDNLDTKLWSIKRGRSQSVWLVSAPTFRQALSRVAEELGISPPIHRSEENYKLVTVKRIKTKTPAPA